VPLLTEEQRAGLAAWGLSPAVEAAFAAHQGPGDVLGRVAAVHYGGAFVELGDRRVLAHPSGKSGLTRKQARVAVGDWVALSVPGPSDATLHTVFPRPTHVTRRAAGEADRAQIIASHVDTVAVVMSCDSDFSLGRLERYLALAHEGSTEAVLVLTKPDLAPTFEELATQARAIVPRAFPVNGLTGEGLDVFAATLVPGSTTALVGSSGVGKSSLSNLLAGSAVTRIGSTRESDGKGRHTTTHRELLKLPSGALLVDTPGMREVGLPPGERKDAADAFDDIALLAAGCRFRDCTHRTEPSCAVKAAVAAGALDERRLDSFHKLARPR
jgi:ribosome biogenesis GTPase / thiamine phosphate phosphatase